jgi:predicted amidophosphoribosyltransferase
MPNHKSEGKCVSCGKQIPLGTCTHMKKSLFGGEKPCGSKGFEWQADDLVCVGCNSVFSLIRCPECGTEVTVKIFEPRRFRDIFK